MSIPTPAEKLQAWRDSLDWAQSAFARQPEALQRRYRAVASTLANALIDPPYSITLHFPTQFQSEQHLTLVEARLVTVHAGGWLNRLQGQNCRAALLDSLLSLTTHPVELVTSIARLIAYLTGECLLRDHIPAAELARQQEHPFDIHKQLLRPHDSLTEAATIEMAVASIGRLSRYVDWLRMVDALYPAWAADDDYDDTYSELTLHLSEQGRALANYQTRQMIDEIRTSWHSGSLTRGLTLFLSYLDERAYQMKIFEIVVIPAGRIPFRPQFIVGACRLAQQKVRKSDSFSQSTRWQLISQLDTIVQAFESES